MLDANNFDQQLYNCLARATYNTVQYSNPPERGKKRASGKRRSARCTLGWLTRYSTTKKRSEIGQSHCMLQALQSGPQGSAISRLVGIFCRGRFCGLLFLFLDLGNTSTVWLPQPPTFLHLPQPPTFLHPHPAPTARLPVPEKAFDTTWPRRHLARVTAN